MILKTGNVLPTLISSSREYQSLRVLMEKARSPLVINLNLGRTSESRLEDLGSRLGGETVRSSAI